MPGLCYVELLRDGDATERAGAVLQRSAQGEMRALGQSILHYVNNTANPV